MVLWTRRGGDRQYRRAVVRRALRRDRARQRQRRLDEAEEHAVLRAEAEVVGERRGAVGAVALEGRVERRGGDYVTPREKEQRGRRVQQRRRRGLCDDEELKAGQCDGSSVRRHFQLHEGVRLRVGKRALELRARPPRVVLLLVQHHPLHPVGTAQQRPRRRSRLRRRRKTIPVQWIANAEEPVPLRPDGLRRVRDAPRPVLRGIVHAA